LELGYEAWLILGNALSTSETCFVLIKEQNEFYIIDPTTGRRYLAKDIYCPLTVCYCLVNHQNLWANIQKESRVFMTQFDVNKSLNWRPLFARGSDIPNTSVHETKFTYEHSYDTNELQKMILAKIIKKINSWRSHRKTVWNRFVSESLKNILVKMEEDVCMENESGDSVELLNSLFSNYKVRHSQMKYLNIYLIPC
jgi:coiled-coil and C2 domain-containing protein 2A